MYKSVKTYLDAVKAADEDKSERDRAAKEAYTVAYAAERDYVKRQQLDANHRSDQNASATLRNAVEAAAWAQLMYADEAAVAWIARNCTGYKDHARIVLRALNSKTTGRQMRALARRSEWCDTFDGLLLQAKQAGVFADEMSSERVEMLRWFATNFNSSATYAAQLEKHLDQVLEVEALAMAAKLVPVKVGEPLPENEVSEDEPEAAPADERELVAA